MEFDELTEYCEGIAKIHPAVMHTDEVKHFFGIDIEELVAGSRSFANYPVVTCDISEARYSGESWDSMVKNWSCGLSFLSPCKMDDYVARKKIITRMHRISEDFFSQFKEDLKHRNVIKTMDYRNVRGYKVGPVFDNLYGWRIELPVGGPANAVMRFDRSAWVKADE